MKSDRDLLAEMSADFGMLPSRMEAIVRTAPLRYKKFQIPKRRGGWRDVAQPAREVKAIQRWVVGKLTNLLPIHEAATGYRTGHSIRSNAAAHANSEYLLKLDFQNFFPSIQFDDLVQHLSATCGDVYDDSARRLLARVCTWSPNRRLPLVLCIGAPSSPFLSNSVMFEFDKRLAAIAGEDGVTYTRYADDLTLSTTEKGVLGEYVGNVSEVITSLQYPRLTLNLDKTVHASRAGRRTVTGVTIDSTGVLSVGRDRKRLIRSMYHRFIMGHLTAHEVEYLVGLMAFVEDIEPGFKGRLERLDKKAGS